ncbi:MAG TPA: regulatory iron-sulfur-containing complex subunit RicT [Anaerolineaceae bacterium]|nr:regulatory iron-sulfur-containing complex subunit RicT [Anaerolineaceae bacterium]HOR83151.1 regulatory iron-sulfur-containing complex subunit RicT [Anaerolineaceae bacterium]HPL43271.1 regulatory iron-sulfur-containing complex subunit RicT [Anaerolineaceae bacterium]
MTEQSIIGVQLSPVGKIYHFSVPEGIHIKQEDWVLVNTARGRQLGRVLVTSIEHPHNADEIQPIERIATEQDLEVKEKNAEKEKAALEKAREYLKGPRFEAVKAFAAEYSFDGNRLTFYLNYEPDAGFDLRAFLRDISRSFRDVRLEVRQVGPRDMAKALSGLGACGIEKRCCSRFLTEFSSISIKMAKSQDISLTPEEITGMCGRLRCCLNYEYETYEEARKNLPKRKKMVQTPMGEGKVIQVLPLSDSVVVELPEGGPRQFTLEELQTGKLAEKTSAPVESPPMPEVIKGEVEILSYSSKPPPGSGSKTGREYGSRRGKPDRRAEQRSHQAGNRPDTTRTAKPPQQQTRPQQPKEPPATGKPPESGVSTLPHRKKRRR